LTFIDEISSQNTVCGTFCFLQNTEYKNGFSADHPAVRMFWSVFHEDLSLEDKKKFLCMWTVTTQYSASVNRHKIISVVFFVFFMQLIQFRVCLYL